MGPTRFDECVEMSRSGPPCTSAILKVKSLVVGRKSSTVHPQLPRNSYPTIDLNACTTRHFEGASRSWSPFFSLSSRMDIGPCHECSRGKAAFDRREDRPPFRARLRPCSRSIVFESTRLSPRKAARIREEFWYPRTFDSGAGRLLKSRGKESTDRTREKEPKERPSDGEGEPEREGWKGRESGQRRAERTTQLHCSSNTCKSGE